MISDEATDNVVGKYLWVTQQVNLSGVLENDTRRFRKARGLLRSALKAIAEVTD